MAQILVRNLDDRTKEKLRTRATRHGRSLESEVREILRDATRNEVDAARKRAGGKGLGTELVELFKGKVPAEFRIPDLRGEPVKPIRFDE